ncbi:ABC transporter permease [Antrihabitans cavernicola]|uniref:ABC transporter permease n=1 Tax=Antrihabitans cavernicola TaxID=2495913 RepID=A0A5A7S876_9NOCA|nr:ABC transporter permease [Spelaeibacter cavernicola]KAA0022126.1 ABC transporter permease [Spelaeibacter cavernicola]
MGVLAAERIKFTSVKSPWWCSLIIVILSLGLAGVMGWVGNQAVEHPDDSGGFPGLTPDVATSGVSGFGIMVLTIMAALVVTSEYRFGLIRTTFQATPKRSTVLVAKALIVGVYGAVLTTVLAFAAFFLSKAIANDQAGKSLVLSGGAAWRAIYGIPIYAFLCVVLAIAVGALLRQSAAAIALLLLWPLLIENLFGLFGTVGKNIQPFLPFLNGSHFLGSDSSVDFHWGPWGSLVYFAVFTGVVFGAAVLVVNRRDA